MTGAFPWFVTGGFIGAAALYYTYFMGDAEASDSPPDIDDRDPIVLTPGGPPRDPGSKLPTEPPPKPPLVPEDIPPNLFVIQSLAQEATMAPLALGQSGSKEGILLVIYKSTANSVIIPELVIAASSYPDVTFLAYPESISKQINATAVVHYTCKPTDIVSIQAFPTVLTQQGPSWGEATVYCVSSPNALEVRAALSTGADAVL